MANPYVSADHIAAAAGGFEPQRQNNFTIVLPVGGRVIQQSLESFPMPKEENEVIAIKFGNETRKVAGPASYSELTLVVKDFVDQDTAKALLEWRRSVYNPATGQIFYASSYKKTAQVFLLGPEGSRIRGWQLSGVWPSKIDLGEGKMDSPSNNMITVTLQVDKALEQF
jgi:hypothetical protein